MIEITELLERVKVATGPDRALDAAILCAFPPFGVKWKPDPKVIGRATFEHVIGDGDSRGAPTYTASIDAALALVKRVMPGWTLRMHIHPGAVYADLYRLGDLTHFPEGGIERRVTSPYYEGIRINDNLASLAVLAALLSALQSRAEK